MWQDTSPCMHMTLKDVESTLHLHHDVALTSIQRCFTVVCQLGSCLFHYLPKLMRMKSCLPIVINVYELTFSHQVGSNQSRYQQSTNVDQKSIETVFTIAIWQSKTLFLLLFYLSSLIVLTFLIAAYLVCFSTLPNSMAIAGSK